MPVNFFAIKLRRLLSFIVWVYICLQLFVLIHFSGNTTANFRREDMLGGRQVVNNTEQDKTLKVESHKLSGLREECHSRVNELRGYHKASGGFLTIGISTVPREKAFYLADTLTSVISKMTEEDKKVCTIVVFMASYNKTWSNKILSMVDTTFNKSLSSGLIRVIQPETGVYPDLQNITRRTFNDSSSRVGWRTKQNIDYSLLFAYCETMSDYYIHIEDDVTAATDFVTEIRRFINTSDESRKYWLVLEFSGLGFIGKLFRSSDLCMISNYLFLFQEDKPCDLLFSDLKRIKMQTSRFVIQKSLFQHNGIASSLPGKVQKLIDKTFKDSIPGKSKHFKDRIPGKSKYFVDRVHGKLNQHQRRYKIIDHIAIVDVEPNNRNPKATIMTTMLEHNDNKMECPYRRDNCFFWTQFNRKGNYYRIIFDKPTLIHNVTVSTGHPTKDIDMIQHGTVTIGREISCNDTHVADFTHGKASAKMEKPLLAECLQIELTKSQNTWVIISNIVINETFKGKNSTNQTYEGNNSTSTKTQLKVL